jgi:hypothetical protein
MKIKDNNTKYVKQMFEQNLILIMFENMNKKWNEQGYDNLSYLVLILKKLMVMGGFTYIYTPLKT